MHRGAASRGGQSDDAPSRRTVVALVLGAVERARITSALRQQFTLVFVERLPELEQQLAGVVSNIAAIILEPTDRVGRSVRETVNRLSRSDTAPPILAYCHAARDASGDVRALVLAGVHELIFAGVDDTGIALRALVEAAAGALVGERVARTLMDLLPARLGPFVRHVTSHPETQRVSDVADALGYHRKTLVNHCASACIPPPQEILAWCRLCVAADLLCETPRTIESVALQLDYPSDTALRNMMKRYTGMRASDVRARGGSRYVASLLSAALDRHRERALPLVPTLEEPLLAANQYARA